MAKLIVAAVLAALCASAATAAEPYPVKPVRIIVAVGAGGGDDFAARQVAAKLSELLGQQFFVENRPGAGGMIGQTFVAKSPPDGYTLLLAGGRWRGALRQREHGLRPAARLYAGLADRDVAVRAVVNPALPARSVREFIALGRARPGKMTFGTLGAGQISYWSVVLFNSMAGIDAVEVQYKSPPTRSSILSPDGSIMSSLL